MGLLVVLLILASGSVIYLNNRDKNYKQENLNIISTEKNNSPLELAIPEQKPLQTEEQSKNVAQKKTTNQIVPTNNTRITSQIIQFEDVLEGKIVVADISCRVLGSYNNMAQLGDPLMKTAFPENPITYSDSCRNDYVPLGALKNRLIAEPELQTLRKILTSYIDSVRELAQYALNGGYSAQILDKYHKDFETYRLDAREELLRLQRQYNVKSKYESIY